MRSFLTFVSLFSITNVLPAQTSAEKGALSEAKQMASFYNQKDFSKYADYLLPSEYDSDTANKRGLVKLFSQNKDTGKLEVIKLLELKTLNGE